MDQSNVMSLGYVDKERAQWQTHVSEKVRELESEIKTYKQLNEALNKERKALEEREERRRKEQDHVEEEFKQRVAEWERCVVRML